MSDLTQVQMDVIPPCDLCKWLESEQRLDGEVQPAAYDAALVTGSWAYVCEAHMRTHGLGLGTGRGQRLVKRT